MDSDFYKNISQLADVIREDLSPISPIIYNVVETAHTIVPECIDVFRSRYTDEGQIPKKVFKWLYPSLMRAIMQVLLHSQNIKTQALLDNDSNLDELLDWEFIILSNNGLAGKYAGYNYRILKSVRGKLPPPGPSRRKQKYYRQEHLKQYRLNLFPEDGFNNIQRPNVIFLWDDVSVSQISLSLSCPRWGNRTRASDHFTIPIEHPVLTYKPEIEPEEIMEEIDLPALNPEVNVSPEEDKQNDIRE